MPARPPFLDDLRALLDQRERETGPDDEITKRTRAALEAAETEYQLFVDRVVFGNSYCLETNDPDAPGGVRRERLDPTLVFIRRPP